MNKETSQGTVIVLLAIALIAMHQLGFMAYGGGLTSVFEKNSISDPDGFIDATGAKTVTLTGWFQTNNYVTELAGVRFGGPVTTKNVKINFGTASFSPSDKTINTYWEVNHGVESACDDVYRNGKYTLTVTFSPKDASQPWTFSYNNAYLVYELRNMGTTPICQLPPPPIPPPDGDETNGQPPQPEPKICGDGLVQQPNDDGIVEQCDGSAPEGYECTTDCKLKKKVTNPVCGNRILETGEQCEKGDTQRGYLCEDCKWVCDESKGYEWDAEKTECIREVEFELDTNLIILIGIGFLVMFFIFGKRRRDSFGGYAY